MNASDRKRAAYFWLASDAALLAVVLLATIIEFTIPWFVVLTLVIVFVVIDSRKRLDVIHAGRAYERYLKTSSELYSGELDRLEVCERHDRYLPCRQCTREGYTR